MKRTTTTMVSQERVAARAAEIVESKTPRVVMDLSHQHSEDSEMTAQKNTQSRGIIDLGTKRMRLKEWCNLPCLEEAIPSK
ncbi:MAG: hypothetical protein ACYCY0_09925 [Acidithiobacillus ferrivorans]